MKANISISVVLFVLFGLSAFIIPSDDTHTVSPEPTDAQRQEWLDAGRARLAEMSPQDSLPDLDQD